MGARCGAHLFHHAVRIDRSVPRLAGDPLHVVCHERLHARRGCSGGTTARHARPTVLRRGGDLGRVPRPGDAAGSTSSVGSGDRSLRARGGPVQQAGDGTVRPGRAHQDTGDQFRTTPGRHLAVPRRTPGHRSALGPPLGPLRRPAGPAGRPLRPDLSRPGHAGAAVRPADRHHRRRAVDAERTRVRRGGTGGRPAVRAHTDAGSIRAGPAAGRTGLLHPVVPRGHRIASHSRPSLRLRSCADRLPEVGAPAGRGQRAGVRPRAGPLGAGIGSVGGPMASSRSETHSTCRWRTSVSSRSARSSPGTSVP